MEKILYIECNMGIAGDMLMSALLDLVENKDEFIEKINSIGIPGVQVSQKRDVKCGITGTHVSVKINGIEEHSEDICENHRHGEHHHHAEDHHHEENPHNHLTEHHHTSMADISLLIERLDVSEKVKKDIKEVYEIIAQAESEVHGKSVSQIHFHEVGMADALADIAGCALLIDMIGADKIIVSPIKTGFGQVKCAHGIMPVPAPATAKILTGIPNSYGKIEGELCTPTGAALAKYFADDFSYAGDICIEKVGYGMGKKDFEAANCVRVMVGNFAEEFVYELACNVDDMTSEEIGYAVGILQKTKALDVYVTPVCMKKQRPGVVISVICKANDRTETIKEIFKHTSTIGIREYKCNRYTLEREIEEIETPMGTVRIKKAVGYGTQKSKPEYEDIARIADKHGMSIAEVKRNLDKYL